jgi:hypothetical protein
MTLRQPGQGRSQPPTPRATFNLDRIRPPSCSTATDAIRKGLHRNRR